MLGHLVHEIIIPNGQRPGVLTGLVVEEVLRARSDIVSGYHRMSISNHRTGYIQSATLFICKSSFDDLLTFTRSVLQKLCKYASKADNLADFPQSFKVSMDLHLTRLA